MNHDPAEAHEPTAVIGAERVFDLEPEQEQEFYLLDKDGITAAKRSVVRVG